MAKTPGVYIEEKSAFPNSVVQVATSVPAFIGYTEKAIRGTKNLSNLPTRISSLSEYINYFGGPPHTTYSINFSNDQPSDEPAIESGQFYLYYSMSLFFNNGGSTCYIVSIGDYQSEVSPNHFFDQDKSEKAVGLKALEQFTEPSLILAPDIMLLSPKQATIVQNQMLNHCGVIMRSRFAILDIPQGYLSRKAPNKADVIEQFRQNIKGEDLSFGAAYYPWVEANIVAANDINFSSIAPKSLESLVQILNQNTLTKVNSAELKPKKAQEITDQINKLKNIDALSEPDITDLHQMLLTSYPLYASIIESLTKKLNLLPPSGGIAGIYTQIDNSRGVWKAPANVSVGSVIRPSVPIDNEDQEDLNMPLNGRAINAIRTFPGEGTLIWGARTLDGNSLDWKYISVRRTVIMIEQSVKNAAKAYIFEPNTNTTWSNLNAMLTNFLTNIWASGALAGATPADAFSVDVGLGITMTPSDILEGIMRISIKLALTRPAEYIVITFEQQMQKS